MNTNEHDILRDVLDRLDGTYGNVMGLMDVQTIDDECVAVMDVRTIDGNIVTVVIVVKICR